MNKNALDLYTPSFILLLCQDLNVQAGEDQVGEDSEVDLIALQEETLEAVEVMKNMLTVKEVLEAEEILEEVVEILEEGIVIGVIGARLR